MTDTITHDERCERVLIEAAPGHRRYTWCKCSLRATVDESEALMPITLKLADTCDRCHAPLPAGAAALVLASGAIVHPAGGCAS